MEERESFAVGHLALGYIVSKASAKLLKTKLNIPVVLLLSVIPDIDILIEMFVPAVKHRGATHSVVMAFVVFIPVFAVYRKKAIPYLVALIQHSLMGDYVSGGPIQLLWPVTTQYYGRYTNLKIQTAVAIEWIVFLTSIIIMLRSEDIVKFFQPHNSNLVLTVPAATLVIPTFLGFPLEVPTWLILPHLAYTILFSASIIIDLFETLRTRKTTWKESQNHM